MTDYYAPKPCLLAIMLTISTHSGPQFVCHYPPVPDAQDFQTIAPLKLRESELQSESSSDSLSDSSSDTLSDEIDEDDYNDNESGSGITVNHQGQKRPGTLTDSLRDRLENQRRGRRLGQGQGQSSSGGGGGVSPRKDRSLSVRRKASDDTLGRMSRGEPDSIHGSSAASMAKGPETWQKVLGLDADFLSELLCPTRGMCNTKFEISVDDMVFLGLPVHILQNGEWKRRQSSKYATTRSRGSTMTSRRAKGSIKKKPKRQDSIDEEKAVYGDDEIDFADNDFTSEEDMNNNDDDDNPTNDYADPRSPMRMFNVAFVMNPPVTEYNLRIDEMYQYVITNFVKCLKHEQAKNNYVWNEVSTMLQIRDEAVMEGLSAHQVWDEMQSRSTLAAAIAQLYTAIANSDVASIAINSKLRSFQIPIQTEFRSLLPVTAPRPNVAFLTTSGPFLDTADESAEGLTAHYAILLLEDPDVIIREIRADPYSTLAAFIREISPMQSIQMMADESGLSVDQIIEITRNLMYWRRARAIIPIHHRNIYIVSPLAPMGDLYKYVQMFDEQFPSLPSLPRILSMLSTGRPRNFSTHIPSRDHRRVYLNALAWLLRYEFVTQLKTFLWIKISKRIKAAVNHDMQLVEDMEHFELSTAVKKHTDTSTDNTSKQRVSPNKSVAFAEINGAERHDDGDEDDDDDANELVDDDEHGSSDGTSESDDRNDEYSDDTILIEPDRALSIQRKWIAKMLEDKPQDVQQVFGKVMKYFNGKHTMEKAMVLENISRQDMRKLTSSLEEHLVVVRHW